MTTHAAKTPENPFLERFSGRFRGIMRWHELDALWDTLRQDAHAGWYLYAVGEAPPDEPATAEQVHVFLTEVDALLRHEHDEDYCGIVYVDDLDSPEFVKIYDPNNLGAVCGSTGIPTLPGWILCKLPPTDLPAAFPPPGARRRWWQRLLGA